MACFLGHDWSWPRRKGGKDVQFCPKCGAERESKVRFGGPHYQRTQDAIPGFVAEPVEFQDATLADETPIAA